MKTICISGREERKIMKAIAVILFCFCIQGCFYNITEEKEKKYTSVAIKLSDFSKKIVAHYKKQEITIPADFDSNQFFNLLKTYPDHAFVEEIKNNYKVSARNINGGYSVMLCDLNTDQKIMEDLSCKMSRVEIQSWKENGFTSCDFEKNWEAYCQ